MPAAKLGAVAPARVVLSPASRAGVTARRQSLVALGLYLGLSAVYVGRQALLDPSGGTIGVGPDVQIFLWGLRWWPYALTHGVNPVVSHVVWSPEGSNVLWTSTVPLLSLLVAPITLTLGPAVAWNLLCILAPATAAWGAYLLCRELTGAFWPSVADGLLFGFSSYELAEGIAHLQMTATLLVPLAALVAVRALRGRMSAPGLATRMGMIAAAQFLISPETLATLTLMGVIAAIAACAILPERRVGIRRVLAWTCAGMIGAGIVVSPLLVQMLRELPGAPMNPPGTYSADLLNLVLSTRITALGGDVAPAVTGRFAGNLAEQGAYVGLPLLLILAGAVWTRRRSPRVRLAAVLLLTSLVFSLGPKLRMDGHAIVWLPWAALAHIPALTDALPARFALYSALAAGVLVAMWLARPGRSLRWRWLAVALVMVSLAPSPTAPLWWQPTPPSVAHNDLGRLIPSGATVVSLPFWSVDDRALYAQAVAGMRFRLDDRWLQLMPRAERTAAESLVLRSGRLSAADVGAFDRAICGLGASYAVVWNDAPARARVLGALHLTPVRADNLLIYRLPRAGCAAT